MWPHLADRDALGADLVLTGVTFGLTLLLSETLLWRYRIAVGRWMRLMTRPADGAAPPVTDLGSARTGSSFTETYGTARVTTPLVYLVVGLGAGAALALSVQLFAFNSGLPAWRMMLVVTLVYCWPVFLILSLVVVASRWTRVAWVLTYFALLALLGAWIEASPRVGAPPAAPNTSADVPMALQVLVFWTSQLLPTIGVVLLLHPRIRAVGPLMFVSAYFVVVASHLALTVTLGDGGLILAAGFAFRGITEDARDLMPVAPKILAGLGLGTAAALSMAFAVVRLQAARYARQVESDQTISADAIWAVFVLAAMVNLTIGSGRWAALSVAVVVMALFKLGTRVGFHLTRRGHKSSGPELLLLRRFKATAQTRRLFPILEAHWRWLGPIHLIGAPDLASRTVTPYRFLDFITGRLRLSFIAEEQALTQRLGELTLAPDVDGRFRVNELFCTTDIWESAVHALMDRAAVVVMDARGFHADPGLIVELRLLQNGGAGQRTIVIYDTEPTRDALERHLQSGGGIANGHAAAPLLLKVTRNERPLIAELTRRAAISAPSSVAQLV